MSHSKLWVDLYRAIEIPRSKHAVAPRLGEAHFTFAESNLRFTLPKSYCEFVKIFGPGIFAREYRIAAPGFPDQFWYENLLGVNEMIYSRLMPPLSPESLDVASTNLVFFCVSEGDSWIGWNRSDPRPDGEFGIYSCGRGTRTPHFLASTFYQFVTETCLAPAPDIDNPDEMDAESVRVYERAVDLSRLIR